MTGVRSLWLNLLRLLRSLCRPRKHGQVRAACAAKLRWQRAEGESSLRTCLISVLLWLCFSLWAQAQQAPGRLTKASVAQTVVLPKSVPDPLEPLNRVVWGFNKALLTDVINPSSRVYRFVVIKPVRRGIGKDRKSTRLNSSHA